MSTVAYSFYAMQPCGRTTWDLLKPLQVAFCVSPTTCGPSFADLLADISAGQEEVIHMGHLYLERKQHGDGE